MQHGFITTDPGRSTYGPIPFLQSLSSLARQQRRPLEGPVVANHSRVVSFVSPCLRGSSKHKDTKTQRMPEPFVSSWLNLAFFSFRLSAFSFLPFPMPSWFI